MARMRGHSAIRLDYLEEAVRRQGKEHEGQQTLLERDGVPLHILDALGVIQAMKEKGYTVYPPCNNVNAKGQCQGHPVEAR